MTGQWRQLAAVNRFIKGKENYAQTGMVAVLVEQRFKAAHIFGRRGNIGALVTAKIFKHIVVVIAEAARVNLHHQTIFNTHTCHLGQHLTAEQFSLFRAGGPSAHHIIERAAFVEAQIGGGRSGVAVVCGGGAHGNKEFATFAVGGQVAFPC